MKAKVNYFQKTIEYKNVHKVAVTALKDTSALSIHVFGTEENTNIPYEALCTTTNMIELIITDDSE